MVVGVICTNGARALTAGDARARDPGDPYVPLVESTLPRGGDPGMAASEAAEADDISGAPCVWETTPNELGVTAGCDTGNCLDRRVAGIGKGATLEASK